MDIEEDKRLHEKKTDPFSNLLLIHGCLKGLPKLDA